MCHSILMLVKDMILTEWGSASVPPQYRSLPVSRSTVIQFQGWCTHWEKDSHALLIENMCITVQGLHLKARKTCIIVHGVTFWVQREEVSLRKILMMDLGHCQSDHLPEAKQLIHHGHWKITVKEEFQGGMH